MRARTCRIQGLQLSPNSSLDFPFLFCSRACSRTNSIRSSQICYAFAAEAKPLWKLTCCKPRIKRTRQTSQCESRACSCSAMSFLSSRLCALLSSTRVLSTRVVSSESLHVARTATTKQNIRAYCTEIAQFLRFAIAIADPTNRAISESRLCNATVHIAISGRWKT